MDIEKLTKDQAVIISGFTGILCGEFSDFHADVEKRLGRGVQTFEFGFKEFMAEVKKLYEADFIKIGTVNTEAAKAQEVPEGFVEKTESNTHHYFKLKDWDEWGCIDGIEDAITSDYDINTIVEVDCLEVIEISNKPCFALLASGKRHGTEVKFFDTKEEATEAQEQKG